MSTDDIEISYIKIKNILDNLSNNLKSEELKEKLVGEIDDFYYHNKRHMYSSISKYVNESSNNIEKIDYILYNIKLIINYIDKIKNTDFLKLKPEDLTLKIRKMYDHISLEKNRITYSIQNQEKNTSNIIQKVNNAIVNYTDKLDEKTKRIEGNLNTNIVSILGIFSAIIFVLFGSLSNFTTVISQMEKADTNKIISLVVAIGFVLLNVVFVLFYCISKITDKNIGRYIFYKSYMAMRSKYSWEVYIDENIGRFYYTSRYKIKFYTTNEYVDNNNSSITKKELLKKIYEKTKLSDSIYDYILKVCNFIKYIYCLLCNTLIGKAIRRFPYVFMFNIVFLIIMFFFKQ